MKKLVILMVSLLILVGINGCGNSMSEPEKVAVGFYQNLFDGKIDDVVNAIDFSEFKDAEIDQAKDKLKVIFQAAHDEMSKKDGVKFIKIKSKGIEYSNDKSSATVTIEMSSPEKIEDEKIEVVKIDKAWKIKLK